jgi:hypothetical protein
MFFPNRLTWVKSKHAGRLVVRQRVARQGYLVETRAGST